LNDNSFGWPVSRLAGLSICRLLAGMNLDWKSILNRLPGWWWLQYTRDGRSGQEDGFSPEQRVKLFWLFL